MSKERYGVQGDGHGKPGLAIDPRVPRKPGSVQLWYVVDHEQTNAWGQSVPVTGGTTEYAAKIMAAELNAKPQQAELAALYGGRPCE